MSVCTLLQSIRADSINSTRYCASPNCLTSHETFHTLFRFSESRWSIFWLFAVLVSANRWLVMMSRYFPVRDHVILVWKLSRALSNRSRNWRHSNPSWWFVRAVKTAMQIDFLIFVDPFCLDDMHRVASARAIRKQMRVHRFVISARKDVEWRFCHRALRFTTHLEDIRLSCESAGRTNISGVSYFLRVWSDILVWARSSCIGRLRLRPFLLLISFALI